MTSKGKAPAAAVPEGEDYSDFLALLLHYGEHAYSPEALPVMLMKAKWRVIDQLGEISSSATGDPNNEEAFVDRRMLHEYAAHIAALVVKAVCLRKMEFDGKWPKTQWQWGMRSWFERKWVEYFSNEHEYQFQRYAHFLLELQERSAHLQVKEPMGQASLATSKRETVPDGKERMKLVKLCREDVLEEFDEIWPQQVLIQKLQFGTFSVKNTSDITWQEWKMMERLRLLDYYFTVNMFLIPSDAITYFLCRVSLSKENKLFYQSPEGILLEITWEMVAHAYGQVYDEFETLFVEGCSSNDVSARAPRRMYEMNVTNQKRVLDSGETRDCVPELVFERNGYKGTAANFVTNLLAEVIFCNTRSDRFTYPMVYQLMLAWDGFPVNWAKAILYGIRTEIQFLQSLIRRARSNGLPEDYEGLKVEWGPTLAPILYSQRKTFFPRDQWDEIEMNWKQIKENKGPSYSSLHDMQAVFDVLFRDGVNYSYDEVVQDLRQDRHPSMPPPVDKESRNPREAGPSNSVEFEGELTANRGPKRAACAGYLEVHTGGSSTMTMDVDQGCEVEQPSTSHPAVPAFPRKVYPHNLSRDPVGASGSYAGVGSRIELEALDPDDIEDLDFDISSTELDLESVAPHHRLQVGNLSETRPRKDVMHLRSEKETLHDQMLARAEMDETTRSGLHEILVERYEAFCSKASAFDSTKDLKQFEEQLEESRMHGGLHVRVAQKLQERLEHFKGQMEIFYQSLNLEFAAGATADTSDNSSQDLESSWRRDGRFALELSRTTAETTIRAFQRIVSLVEKEVTTSDSPVGKTKLKDF